MKRYVIIGVLAGVVLFAAPARANLLTFPECPPGVKSTVQHPCTEPLKFYEEPLFRLWTTIGSAALLAFLGLRIIRNRHVV